MKFLVWQVLPLSRFRFALPDRLPASGSFENWTPTLVTPSMSLRSGDEARDRVLAAGAADQSPGRARGSLLRSATLAAPLTATVGLDGAGQVGQPDVARQDQREFAHHLFPVEAAVGEARHRGDPLVRGLRRSCV